MKNRTLSIFFTPTFSFLSRHAFAQKTETQLLSGWDKDHTVDWDFYCTGGRNSGKWTKIPVPSNRELKSFCNHPHGKENN